MKTIETIKMEKLYDEDPDYSYLEQNYSGQPDAEKYKAQDKERLEALFNGEWGFIGIRAKARLRINGTFQTIESAGLWGIEDDSNNEYFDEVYKEEFEDLKAQLKEIGFSEKQILEARK